MKISILNQNLLTLGITGLLMIAGAYFQQDCPNWFNITPHTQSWIQGGLLNLGSGFIGSVIVIFLYNRLQEKIKEGERIKRQNIALNELGMSLRTHMEFLLSLYEATSYTPLAGRNSSARDALLATEHLSNLKYLDITKPSSQSSFHHSPWWSYLHFKCSDFSSSLVKIQTKYYSDLDTRIIEYFSIIDHDGFMQLSNILPNLISFVRSNAGIPSPRNIMGNDETTKEHYSLIADLIDCYNERVSEKQKIVYEARTTGTGYPPAGGRIDNDIFKSLL